MAANTAIPDEFESMFVAIPSDSFELCSFWNDAGS